MSKQLVYDLETLKGLFLATFYNLETEEFKEFEISVYQNDLYSLIKFYNNSNIDEAIGYNNLDFDAQVMEFILNSFDSWHDKSGHDIAELIHKFVQNLIENSNYGIRVPYRNFSVNQLDCFKILGLDNEARRTSLKNLQCVLNMESVETMPIDHNTSVLTVAEVQAIKSYCKNDVKSTAVVYNLIKGDTDHALHKGKNLLILREDIQKEFGINCKNFSDLKLGDELMKVSYAKRIKKEVKDLPKKGTFRTSIKLEECLASYIKFKGKNFNELLEKIKGTTLKSEDALKYVVKYGNTEYNLMLGGLHSCNSNEVYIANDQYDIKSLDVNSMYPAGIINNKVFPKHLGPELLEVYTGKYEERVSLKPFAKTDKSIAAKVEALKLMLNGFFGKMGSKESLFYDKKALLTVTLTGQLSLLMLVEMLELEGCKVIVANTDGLEAIVPKNKTDRYYEICKEWEEITSYSLEFEDYSKIFMRDVNNYASLTTSGKIKQKGIFAQDRELWKDSSMRIRALALSKYFFEGVSPEEFIRSHTNIFDFCIRARTNGKDYLQLEYPDGSSYNQGKLLRFYLTNEKSAGTLYKVYGATGAKEHVAASNILGNRRVAYYNIAYPKLEFPIDYNQYIYETYRVIAAIEHNKKDSNFVDSVLNPYGKLF